MQKHLKTKKYYEDLYDKQTVEDCRYSESLSNEIVNNKSDIKKVINDVALNLLLYCKTGERYLDKEETINKWIKRDKLKDELLEKSIQSENIYCNQCNELMSYELHTLHIDNLTKKDRVLYIFRCSKCRKGKGVFENGEEYIRKPELCEKCNTELSKRDERKNEKIITFYECPECGFKKKEELDLSENKGEKEDKNFKKDKLRFCLSKEKGNEYYDFKIKMDNIQKVIDKQKEKDDNKELYKKVSELKKLNVVALEKLLTPALEKEGYIRFELSEPEIGKDVFIKFFVRDEKSEREEYNSKSNLKKIIKKTLKNTNWRLMSEGLSYRLGILSGRLRGYEKEEDLIKLIK